MNRETSDRLVGTIIDDRFRLDRLLGKGGMGRVYAGTQLSMDRSVAIKILREEISDSEIVERRFFREAKMAAAIRHPNVVSIIDFGRDPHLDALYIVMEFVEGKPLSALLKRGRLRLPLALHVARQICSGLSEAHAAGIVHRDLKPDNVMLQRTAEGMVRARLLDFGIALPSGEDTRFTATGAVIGTPHYMAPEQAQDQPIDGRADLHALGVVLYEMLTGRLPWVAETPMAVLLKVVTTPPPPLEETLPRDELPPAPVCALLDSLLAKDPDDRPETASTTGRRLSELAVEFDAHVPSVPTLEALSDAVVDRESDELALGGTATAAATPVREPMAGQPPDRIVAETTEESDVEEPVSTAPPSTAQRPRRRSAIGVALIVLVAAGLALAFAVLGSIVIIALFGRPESDRRRGTEPTSVVAPSSDDDFHEPEVVPPEPPVVPQPPLVPEPPSVSEPPLVPEPAAIDRREADVGATAPRGRADGPPSKPPAAKAREVPAEITPPVDDELLGSKIRLQGGFCPDNQNCTFSPGARDAVCRTDSDCSFDCTAGGCLQQCEQEASCTYDCSGGSCHQFCSGQSTCTLTCTGGNCTQYCHDEATCEMSCAGGGCNRRRFDDADITER